MVLSCDDACASDVRVAELCGKYGIECVFYWPVDWHSVAYAKGYEPLNFLDAEDICNEFEIGSHGITHEHLTSMPLEQAKYEISESKHILEHMLGLEHVDKFAPSRGYTNPELTEYTLEHYGSQRLTKGNNLVHIHPKSGANGNLPWQQAYQAVSKNGQDVEAWCHSWELDKYDLWAELENFLKEQHVED